MRMTVEHLQDGSVVVSLAQRVDEATYCFQIRSSRAEQLNYRSGWRKLLADRIRRARHEIRRNIEEDKK